MRRSSSSAFENVSSRNALTRIMLESTACNGILSTQKKGGWLSMVLFRVFQVIVIFTRLITPFSYLYLLTLFYFVPYKDMFTFHRSIGMVILTTWMCIEALFFPYYIYLFLHLNNANDGLKHLATDEETRMKLVKQCFHALYLTGLNYGDKFARPELYIRRCIEGWFLDCPLESIQYENVFSWCAWAYYGKDENHLTLKESAQNHAIVKHVERMTHHSFPKGKSKAITPLRLNLDPIFVTQRPFLFYALIGMINLSTHILMLLLLDFHILPEYSTKNQSQKIYYRQGSDPKSTSLPIIFVHGIGIGFAHYFAILYNLPTDVDVYLVEWPHVSMQMASEGPVPEESIAAVVQVLRDHGHSKACFVAHSLGTVLISWFLHDSHASTMVASTVLIDPIIFLLIDPTVASVFVYKDPENVVDLLMHFFLSRELFISNALSRHFTWSYNVLFVEDLYNNKKCCQSLHSHLVLDLLDVSSSHDHNCVLHLTHTNPLDEDTSNKENMEEELLLEEPLPEGQQTHSLDYFEAHLDEDNPTLLRRKSNRWLTHLRKHQDIEHTFIFSKQDFIVPVESVVNYLRGKSKMGFASFEVLEFPGTHGEIMLSPKWIQIIANKIKDRYSNGLNKS